jgi:hypothetical protein
MFATQVRDQTDVKAIGKLFCDGIMVERAGLNNKKAIEATINALIPVQSVTCKNDPGKYFIKFKDMHCSIDETFIKNLKQSLKQLKVIIPTSKLA